MITKSQKMSIFNKARAAVRAGKLDAARTNKAFGIIQSKQVNEKIQKYNASINGCDCPDHRRTGKPCKHMIAAMMLRRIEQTAPVQAPKVYAASNGDILMAEQISRGSYRIHAFADANEYIEYASKGGKWVTPSQATGRRIHPDEVHNG